MGSVDETRESTAADTLEHTDVLVQGLTLTVLFKKSCHLLQEDRLNAVTGVFARLRMITHNQVTDHVLLL